MHDTTLRAPATTYGDIVCARVLRKELVSCAERVVEYIICVGSVYFMSSPAPSAGFFSGKYKRHARTHTHTLSRTRTRMHARMHAHMHARTHARTHTKVHTHLIKILHSILLLQPSAPPNAWRWRWRMLLLLLLLLLLSLKQLT